MKNSLFIAVHTGQLEQLAQLIENGGDIDCRNHDGQTLLMFAINHKQIEIIKYLLEMGAEPRLLSLEGKSALEYAEAAQLDQNLIDLIKIYQSPANISEIFQIMANQNNIVGQRAADERKKATDLLAQIIFKLIQSGCAGVTNKDMKQPKNISINSNDSKQLVVLNQSFMIRPRMKGKGVKANLAGLDFNQLLSAVAVNFFGDKKFNGGTNNALFCAEGTLRWQDDSFAYKAHDNKLARTPSIPMPTADALRAHKLLLGANTYFININARPGMTAQTFNVVRRIRGKNFNEILITQKKKNSSGGGLFPYKIQFLELFILLANLHAMGFMHRDIKPENLMVEERSSKIFIIDTDFLRLCNYIIGRMNGTALYMPLSKAQKIVIQTPGISTPYQDIYGLVLSILSWFMSADEYNSFYNLQNLNQLEVFLRRMFGADSAFRTRHNSSYINILCDVIFAEFEQKEVSAIDVIKSLLESELDLLQHALITLTNGNERDIGALLIYCGGLDNASRADFIAGLCECLMDKQKYPSFLSKHTINSEIDIILKRYQPTSDGHRSEFFNYPAATLRPASDLQKAVSLMNQAVTI